MKNINTISRKLLIVLLLFTLSLSAQTYEDNYSVDKDLNKNLKENTNTFMRGSFEEIVRFDMFNMNENNLDENSKNNLDSTISTIKKYIDDGKNIKVTLIGHTHAVSHRNEVTVDSDTYANQIQNWFRSSLDTNESNELSQNYALDIQKIMTDNNISKDVLVVENRRGDDLGFSDATDEGRELSNRVMVTMYVLSPEDIDSDRDGVFDQYDKCPVTLRGLKVDIDGCPIDKDADGVLDYKDQCPHTPIGASVNNKGCPLDSDGDGVVDYKDKCSYSPSGLSVDSTGCPLKQELKINFKSRSHKILSSSKAEIEKFAQYLKENKLYKVEIVGHTDSVGRSSDNMDLSQRRAKATIKALKAEGIDPSRMTSRGRGELDPIKSNRTKEGRDANRRIEISLLL